ncbi:MAG TPA: 3'(2'),5'-bisphosphate nucleotidase CysQ [Thermomonospora sp.]|nr:3'(2'),5'-bisphosphate nucleotidase CysQ [Thermomonospora sp.]
MAPFTESDDHVLAAELATAAGEVLLGIRARVGHADGRALKDAGDRGSHEFLMAELAARRPGDAVLSEEGKDDPVRLDSDRVWIVDPLDGTREFSEEGRTDWAVHVALWERGRLAAGAVALPAQGRTLHTFTGPPAVVAAGGGRSPLEVPAPEPGRLRVAVSRTRPPRFVQELAERLDVEVELVPIGSAGAKISAVLLGDVDAYVHAGGQYEWDNAAPAAVALAAGAHATRVDGADLTYNAKDPLLPDILVCHPVSAPTLLAGIRDVTHDLPG